MAGAVDWSQFKSAEGEVDWSQFAPAQQDFDDPRDIKARAAPSDTPPSSAIQDVNTRKPTLLQQAQIMGEAAVPQDADFAPEKVKTEVGKGIVSGVYGAGQIITGLQFLSATQQGRYIANELKAMQDIDQGKPLAKPAGPTSPGQTPFAEAYAGASPQERAQMRQQFVANGAQTRDMQQAALSSWKEFQAKMEKASGRTPNLTDVDDVKSFGDWLAYNSGQGAVYIVPMMIAALGGPATLGVTSYAMGVGDLTQNRMGDISGAAPNLAMGGQQMERGTPASRPEVERVGSEIERGQDVTGLLAIPYAGFDVALGPAAKVAAPGVTRALGIKVGEAAAKGGIKAGVKAAAKEVGKEMGEEFIGEGGQEFLQSLQDSILDDASLFNEPNLKRWLNAAAAGAAGAAMPAAGHAAVAAAEHGQAGHGKQAGKAEQPGMAAEKGRVDTNVDWKQAEAMFEPERAGDQTVYRAPNGARITPDQWDNASARVRQAWLTPEVGAEQNLPDVSRRTTTDARGIDAQGQGESDLQQVRGGEPAAQPQLLQSMPRRVYEELAAVSPADLGATAQGQLQDLRQRVQEAGEDPAAALRAVFGDGFADAPSELRPAIERALDVQGVPPRPAQGFDVGEPGGVEEVAAAPAPREDVSSPLLDELERLQAGEIDPAVSADLGRQAKAERARLEAQRQSAEFLRASEDAKDPAVAERLRKKAMQLAGIKEQREEKPKAAGIKVTEGEVEHIEALPPPSEAEVNERDKWMREHQLDEAGAVEAARIRDASEINEPLIKQAAQLYAKDHGAFMRVVEGVLNAQPKPSAAAANAGRGGSERGVRGRGINAGERVPEVEGRAAAQKPAQAAKPETSGEATVRNQPGNRSTQAGRQPEARPAVRVTRTDSTGKTRVVGEPKHSALPQSEAAKKLERISRDVQAQFPSKKVKFVEAKEGDAGIPKERWQMARVAQRIVEQHGGKVIFFRHEGPLVTRGFSAPQDRNTVYVAMDVDNSAMAVMGHEFGHWLKKNHSDLHDEFTKKLMPHLRDIAAHARKRRAADAKAGQAHSLTDKEALEELTSDVWGDFFTDPEFHAELAKRDPGTYERFAKALIKFIDDVVRRVGAMRPLGSEPFIADMKKAREVAVDTLAKLRSQQREESDLERRVSDAQAKFSSLPETEPFYSELAHQVDAIPAKGMPAADWITRIKALKGVKPDEIAWSGIEDWLKLQQGRVAKSDVQQFLRQNGVRVEETMLGLPTAPEGYEITPTADNGGEEARIEYQGGGDIGKNKEAATGDDLAEAARSLAARFDRRGQAFREDVHRPRGTQEERARAMAVANHWHSEARRLEAFANNLDGREGGVTKFGEYQLPGGKNYRELLLRLPTTFRLPTGWTVRALDEPSPGITHEVRDEAGRQRGIGNSAQDAIADANTGNPPGKTAEFKSSHFPDQRNILAHVRFNERTDAEGKRVLFLEEIQSDWAQKGKREGFATPEQRAAAERAKARMGELSRQIEEIERPYPRPGRLPDDVQARVDALRAEMRAASTPVFSSSAVPPAPFVGKTESWVALALKRMIRYAAENGFDRVAWANGEQQAARYDLSKKVRDITWHPESLSAREAETSEARTEVEIDVHEHMENLVVDKNGKVIESGLAGAVGKNLDEVIGKEIARKILEKPSGLLRGPDLKIGGEGMRAFYDKIVPNVANDVLKKVGGERVGTVALGEGGERFFLGQTRPGYWRVMERNPETGVVSHYSGRSYADIGEARAVLERAQKSVASSMAGSQPGFDITDAMREKALGGMPMFKELGDDAQSRENDRISPRRPTAVKRSEDPLAGNLQPDIESMARDPSLLEHNVDVLYDHSPDLKPVKGDAVTRARAAVEHFKRNLLWLHDHFTKDQRDRSRLWYVGGNRIAHRFADRFGLEPRQSAAVIAALSPQKDWFQNVSLAERLMSAVTEYPDHVFDGAMDRVMRERDWGQKLPAGSIESLHGKTLRELYGTGTGEDLMRMAYWIRAWDEAHNPQMARVITPEGEFGDWDRAQAGEPIKLRAQSFQAMTKALLLMADGSRENIDAVIGANHKVRSFYNNIIAPDSRSGDVTIDTHAMAAAHLQPLGSSDALVIQGFGGGLPGEPGTRSSTVTGTNGNYPIYAQAYREAAAERGILPREMQSITWEAVRGLFRPEQKKGLKAGVAQVWENFRKGKIDENAARKQIDELAGGVEAPKWAGPSAGRHEGTRHSSYARELSADGVPGRSAETAAGGDRGGSASTGEALGTPEGLDERIQFAPPADGQLGTVQFAPPSPLARLEGERRFERLAFDKFNRTLQAEEAVNKVAAPVADQESIRLAEKLFHGRAQHEGEEFERKYVEPLGDELKAAKRLGITVRDADDFMMALHAPERNATMKQRDPQGRDGLSGLTDQQASQIIASFTPAQITQLNKIRAIVHAMTRANLDRLVDAGLITPATRAQLNAQWKNYVPLKTLDEEDRALGTGRGFEMWGTDIKTALGRMSKAGSPIAATLMDSTRTIIRAEKARVEQAMWAFAQRPEAHDIMRPYDPDNPPASVMTRTMDQNTGQWKEIVDSSKVKDQTMHVMINGQDQRIYVPDELLREQLRKAGAYESLTPLLEHIATVTRTMGRTLTEWNPSFTLPNAIKDAISAVVRARGINGMSAARVVAGIPKAWASIVQEKRGKTTGMAASYERFKELGGKTGAYGITGWQQALKDLAHTGAELGYPDKQPGAVKRALRKGHVLLDALSAANEVLEYATRLSAFEEARRAGYSDMRAAEIGKEITVNFNRAGELSRGLNAFFVFFNAALQGLYGSVHFASTKTGGRIVQPDAVIGKRNRRALYTLAAIGFVLQGMNEMLGGDDDDTGEPSVNTISDYTLDHNATFDFLRRWLPTGFKIPLPPEYSFAYAIGRRIYRAGSQRHFGKEAAGIAGNLMDATLPLKIQESPDAPTRVLKALTGTPLAPWMDIAVNQNFMGSKIVPDQKDPNAPQPWHTIARRDTSEIAKSVSRMLNSIGGDDIEPGPFQKTMGKFASPEAMEHIVAGYTGGLGQTVMQSANVGKSVAGQQDAVDINRAPVVGRFLYTQPKGYAARRYRELASGENDSEDTGFAYEKRREAAGLPPKDPAMRAILPQFEDAEKELRRKYAELRAAEEHGEKDHVAAIRDQIAVTQRRVIKAYTEAKRASQ